VSDLKNKEAIISKIGTGGNKYLAVKNNRIVEQGLLNF